MADHYDVSEIVAGKILTGEFNSKMFRSVAFHEPYNEMIAMLQQGKKQSEIFALNISAFDAAKDAAKAVNGSLSPKEYKELLEERHAFSVMADKLDRISKKLRKGNGGDLGKLTEIVRDFHQEKRNEIVNILDVEDEIPLMLSGTPAIDKWLGGFPIAGMVILGAETKVGKTTNLLKLIVNFLKQYPDKTSVIFSLEMVASQIKARLAQLVDWDESILSRFDVKDGWTKAEDVQSYLSTVDNLGIFGVDFVNLMPETEESEQSMTNCYRMLARACTDLKVPGIVLTQLTMNGGIPSNRNIRYTKSGGNLCSMSLHIYDPYADVTYDDGTAKLLKKKKKAYLVNDLARFGVPDSTAERGFPGAIRLPYTRKHGFNFENEGKWFGLRN